MEFKMPNQIKSENSKNSNSVNFDFEVKVTDKVKAFNFQPSTGRNFSWDFAKDGFSVDGAKIRHSKVRDLITDTQFIEFDEYQTLLDANEEVENNKMREFFNSNKDKFVHILNQPISFLGVKKNGAKFGIVYLETNILDKCKGEKVIDAIAKNKSK